MKGMRRRKKLEKSRERLAADSCGPGLTLFWPTGWSGLLLAGVLGWDRQTVGAGAAEMVADGIGMRSWFIGMGRAVGGFGRSTSHGVQFIL